MIQPSALDPESPPPRPRHKETTTASSLCVRESIGCNVGTAEAWYWKVLSSFSSLLIAFGFLLFGGAFVPDTQYTQDQQQQNLQRRQQEQQRVLSVTVAALVMITSGFILSVVLWFLQRDSLFQLDHIFLPCLRSSLLGLLNSVVVPRLVLNTFITFKSVPILASLLVALASTLVYAVLTAVTWRRIRLSRGDQSAAAAIATTTDSNSDFGSDLDLEKNKLSRSVSSSPSFSSSSSSSSSSFSSFPPSVSDGVARAPAIAAAAAAAAVTYVSEAELQRRQMSKLLQQTQEVTAATLASWGHTYHLDMPVPARLGA